MPPRQAGAGGGGDFVDHLLQRLQVIAGVVGMGIVRRPEEAVGAVGLHHGGQGALVGIARDPDLAAEIVARFHLQGRAAAQEGRGRHAVQPVEPVADPAGARFQQHELQLGEAVEGREVEEGGEGLAHAVAGRRRGEQRQAMAVLEARRAQFEGLEGGMDGDRHVELDGLGVDRIVRRIAVRLVRRGEGHDEGAAAAVLHRALQFEGGGRGITERKMGDRDQPALRGAAEIGDPAVVGAAIGLAQLDVGELGLPQDAEGGIEHRRLEPLGVQQLQPFVGIAGAVRHVGGVGLVGMRLESFQVLLAHAAQGGGIALARALAGQSADLEIFQPLGVALHAQRAVAVLGLDVVIPQAGVFQHMAVGVDGALVLEMMNRTGIEYRSHYRSSPASRP